MLAPCAMDEPLELRPVETELKLALPVSNPELILNQLAALPVLAGFPAEQLRLHTVYHDTPERRLQREGFALRLRRIDGEEEPVWQQTLKCATRPSSALSRRGEWESVVNEERLDFEALRQTPLATINADGTLEDSLVPLFATDFSRTRWIVRTFEGSVVEVAFDHGEIKAGKRRVGILEIELELSSGSIHAVLDLARQIARSIAVLPASLTKAERGYALAGGSAPTPGLANPLPLNRRTTLAELASGVLSESFDQFSRNLIALRDSDSPDLVHQARVGWRRFKSSRKLLRKELACAKQPDWQALKPLLEALGTLRDLDVACLETLPRMGDVYAEGNLGREQAWQYLLHQTRQASRRARKQVRALLGSTAISTVLVDTIGWLERISSGDALAQELDARPFACDKWARCRIAQVHRRMQKLLAAGAKDPEKLHEARLIAKQLRYSIETLQPLLTPKRSRAWLREAKKLQRSIGNARDLAHAGTLAVNVGADPGIPAFFRGMEYAKRRPRGGA